MFEKASGCVEALASASFVISNAADCAGSAVQLRVTGGRQ